MSTQPDPTPGFTGFPEAALDFYDDLEVENTKSFWEAHRHVYAEAVRTPMTALTAALEKEFGPAKVFRPYRDVRFAKDKTPYKTHQGAYVGVAPSVGYYVQVAAPGVRVSGGFYHPEPADLASIRDAIDHDGLGAELETVLARLRRKGFERGGETLKTSPRGYDADHPRIGLLRHKSMVLTHDLGFAPVVHTPDLLDRVRRDWRALRPLVEWFAQRVA